MLAVLVLNNGEPWSGGMAQYVAWATHTRPPFSMRQTDWDAYHEYVNHFYRLDEATGISRVVWPPDFEQHCAQIKTSLTMAARWFLRSPSKKTAGKR